MEYKIALSPNLNVSAEEFAAAWNRSAECYTLAQAALVAQPAQGFIDPQLVSQGLIALTAAAGGLALDALKEAVKDKLSEFFKEKLIPQPAIEVKAVRQPGGAYLLVVTESK